MKLLFLFSFIMSWCSAFNQAAILKDNPADLDNEQIFVHTNSTFLMTGETIYFKIYCQQRKNNKPTILSKVAYLELIDELGTPVFQTKISLRNGSGYGDFFIPSTFSSGNYTLIGYTRWMRNFSSNEFFKSQITIVNPFSQLAVTSTNSDKKISPDTIPTLSQSNHVLLKLSAKKFKVREKVSVTLSANDVTDVSISVRKKETAFGDAGTILKRSTEESIHSDSSTSAPFSSKKESQSSSRTKTYLPEIRGHLITGTITPKGQGSSKQNILASIPGSDFVFRAAATDQNGKFFMIVDHIVETSTMIFQIQDEDISNYTLKIDDPFLGEYSEFKSEPLSMDADLQVIIDERNIYTQIENAYYATKKDSVPLTPSRFYNLPDKVYLLDDYTRFPTMEDIFREYILEVVVKRRGNNFSLQVVSPSFGDPPPKEPLMLINGVPILNTNTLMAYDPLKIERIEVVKAKYFYGSLDIDGIVSMKTYKGAIEDLPAIDSHSENLVNIQSDKIYFFPDYSADKLMLERIPDYRLQLYWNPHVSVTKAKSSTLDFYTSDVMGDFEIIVEGFSKDGTLVSAREVISVLK